MNTSSQITALSVTRRGRDDRARPRLVRSATERRAGLHEDHPPGFVSLRALLATRDLTRGRTSTLCCAASSGVSGGVRPPSADRCTFASLPLHFNASPSGPAT